MTLVFIRRHCEDPRDFSRQRLLTFERVALFFLQGACSSLRFGMQQLLQSLLGNGGFQSGLTVSRQAVSKACRKFPYQAFVSLQQQAVDTFYAQRDTPRWMGLRLVGVDGTKVRLPRTSTMAQAFGTQTNDRKRARPMALMVAHYDVLARVPLCAELSPCSMGERFLAVNGQATACRTESRRFVALRSWLSLLCVVCIASGTRCAGLHAPASPVPSGCRCVYREWSG